LISAAAPLNHQPGLHRRAEQQAGFMRSWAILFLIIALILAFFGFIGVSATAADMVKILSFPFLVGFFYNAPDRAGRA